MELRDFLLQGLKNSSSTPQAQQKAATIARSIPQTAPPAQTVSRSSSAPKGFNRLRSLWSRGFDQANIFDNNLTWKQRTPTQSKSVLDQTGQAGGQLTRATVGNLTKMVNTGLAQVPQVIDTGRMLAADFTNNDQAWKNANEAALKDNQRFQEGKGGLLNVGTLYNAQDARNGNWTGVRKIVQGTGMAGLDVASLMTGANVGASVAKNGVGAGLKAEAGNLAKSGLLNTVQGGAQAYQDGSRNVGDIAKAALVSGALGTAGDVGLGLAGAAAGNAAKVVTTKLVTNRTPLNNAGSTPIGGPLVPIPKKIVESIINAGKVKQGKLRQRITTNDKYPQPVRDMAEGTYVVKDNKTTIKHAKDLIRTDIGLAEERALHPKNAVDVQINAELFNHYSQLGKTAEANNLLKGLDETNMGQMVQILSQYDKTSPQGIVRFAQNTIKNYNKTVPDGKKLQISDSQIKSLTDKAIKIQKMPDGKPRNLASRQLIEDVNKLIPSTITDKAITLWKAGLLTSPRTTMRNVLGNTIHGITEIAKDAPAAINDRLLQTKTGSRTLTMTTKGVGSGAKEGFNVAKDVMKFGFDPEESISKFDIKKVNWGDGPMGKAGKVYTDTVFNFLGAQDKPFYHAAFARSLYDQAGAIAINSGKKGNKQFIENLVKNPNTQMLKTATQDASVATFKDVNVLGKIARDVKGRLGKSEAGKAASEIIAPFTGVPSSIAGQILQYSPIGLAKGIVKDTKVLSGKVPELQRLASQEIGRGVVGSGLLGIGAYLTAKGLMTGNPKDANEARQWQLEGKQANSVLINGKWRSINSVGPEALVVLAGSKIQSGAANGEGASSIAGNLGKDFTQQTFLQGVQGPLNAITDPSRYGKQYINQQVASVVPNIVKDTAKALDSTQRETNSVSDALKAAIPGVRNDLLPKQDALGNPVKQEPTGLNAYVDLFNSKTPVKGNVVDELSRLYGAGQSATPPKQDAKTSINGVKVELTPKQRNELEKNIGTSTNTGFDGFMKTDQYKALNDEQKKQVLDDFRQDITTVEKKKYAMQNKLGAYAPGSTDNEKPTTVRQNKIIDGSITIDEYIKKTSTTGKTTGKKSSYKDKYQSLLNESNDPKNGWSDITRAVKEKELKKLSVQKDYDDDTVTLYGMSKADAYDYLTKSPKGKELADKLIAYDNALFDAGLSKYKKFKNGLAPAAKKASKGGSGKGRKGSGKARKGKKVASKYSYKLFAFNSSPSSTSKSLRDVLKKATIKG